MKHNPGAAQSEAARVYLWCPLAVTLQLADNQQ